MTLTEMQRLWQIARLLHETRRDMAWGSLLGPRREPFPEYHPSYTHNPISYVDLALAQAKALSDAGLLAMNAREEV